MRLEPSAELAVQAHSVRGPPLLVEVVVRVVHLPAALVVGVARSAPVLLGMVVVKAACPPATEPLRTLVLPQVDTAWGARLALHPGLAPTGVVEVERLAVVPVQSAAMLVLLVLVEVLAQAEVASPLGTPRTRAEQAASLTEVLPVVAVLLVRAALAQTLALLARLALAPTTVALAAVEEVALPARLAALAVRAVLRVVAVEEVAAARPLVALAASAALATPRLSRSRRSIR